MAHSNGDRSNCVMPRLPRFFLPGLPLHVVQRGNDRAPIFGSPADYGFFRECLAYSARKHRVAIHAYVQMTNHVHLLVTPATPSSTPKMMQAIGRVYVQFFNATRGRTGTLWEGRYKAALVEDERYLLTCMRYIELNPVRAGIVTHPAEYAWSSYCHNALGAPDDLVTPHPVYRRLGVSPEAWRSAYRDLFRSSIPDLEMSAIRDATQNAWVLGDEAFCKRIEAESGRRAARAPKGRTRRGRRLGDKGRV